MTNFICAACRGPATEDNKVHEDCGRLVHAKGCDYKSPEPLKRNVYSCKRCGVNIYMIDPRAFQSLLPGVDHIKLSTGPLDDALCAFCVIQVHGVEKARELLRTEDKTEKKTVSAPLASGTVIVGGKEFCIDWSEYTRIVQDINNNKIQATEGVFLTGCNTTSGTLPAGQAITFGLS